MKDADLLRSLGERTANFSGADLGLLVSEASLCALKMTYPQIYSSSVKLQINVDRIVVKAEHFERALALVSPSCARAAIGVPQNPLQNAAENILLGEDLRRLHLILEQDLFPAAAQPNAVEGNALLPVKKRGEKK